MGTRACFWIGDPRDLNNREWLGAIAFDGHISNFASDLSTFDKEEDFRAFVKYLSLTRTDFAHPGNGFPYPWDNDVFLTDVTYAWTGNQVMATSFHEPMRSIEWWIQGGCDEDFYDDPSLSKIPATEKYNPKQPDSILTIRFTSNGGLYVVS